MDQDITDISIRDDNIPDVERLQSFGPPDECFPIVSGRVQVPQLALLQMLESAAKINLGRVIQSGLC